jgi:hypothetical protein
MSPKSIWAWLGIAALLTLLVALATASVWPAIFPGAR